MQIIAELGFDNRDTDSDETKRLRQNILKLASSVCWEDPEIQKAARAKFDAAMEDLSVLSADAREPVFSIMVQMLWKIEIVLNTRRVSRRVLNVLLSNQFESHPSRGAQNIYTKIRRTVFGRHNI